jgi:hypothetical protein
MVEAAVALPGRVAETGVNSLVLVKQSRGGGEKTVVSRKVRTPQGGVVGEPDPGKPAGQCHRNKPPKRRATREPVAGKGEMVR